MSAYQECETKITDGHHLVAAIIDMGFTPVVYDQPMSLIGYHGDERPEKATIIIPRAQIGGASNDVGFCKRPDGRYEAIISQFDSNRFNASWLGKLAQNYSVHRAMSIGAQKGYRFLGKTEVDGKIKLQFGVR